MIVGDENDEFERLPGLYGAWDLGMLLEEGRSYRIEDGGRTDDGQPLYIVFHRTVSHIGIGTCHDG